MLRRIRKQTRLLAASLYVCLFMAVIPGAVHAEPIPTCSESPSDKEVAARLHWIEHRLAAGTPYAASWWAGWLTFATAEGIWGWVKFAHTRDRLDRDTWLVTGVGSALWVPQLLIFPLRSAYAVRGVRRLPRDTPAQRRDALKKAERLLERAADSEREGTGWEEHVLDTAWTVGSTAYIFGRSWRAGQSRHVHHRVLKVSAIELVLSELVTEANILSTPRKAIRDYDHYRAAGCDAKSSDHAAAPVRTQAWNVSVGASHFALTFRF